MRNVAAVLFIGAFVAGFWLARTPQSTVRPPGVTARPSGFEPAVIDLGAQYWDTEVPFSLRFVNRGADPLTLMKVERSCDCTLFDQEAVEGATLAPGQTLDLPASLKVGQRPGDVVREVAFVDAAGVRYASEIKAHVEPTYHLTPDRLDFELIAEDPSTQTVHFDSARSRVVDAKPSAGWLSVEFSAANVSVTVDPAQLASARDYGAVTLFTDDPYLPAVSIPVTITKFHEINCTPANVFLAPGQRARVTVTDVTRVPLAVTVDSTLQLPFLVTMTEAGALLIGPASQVTHIERYSVVLSSGELRGRLTVTVLPDFHPTPEKAP